LGRDGSDIDLIWARNEAENFLEWGWTGQITLIRFSKFRHARKSEGRAVRQVETEDCAFGSIRHPH
jgi:hypothetical protein